MKKIALITLLVLVTTGTFAQTGMSIGGGGTIIDFSLNNALKIDISGIGDLKYGLNNVSFGGFFFFDAVYAEIDIGYAFGSLDAWTKDIMDALQDEGIVDGRIGTLMQLQFSLLGKYPIEFGRITVFPLIGISYNRVLLLMDDDGNSFKDAGKWLSQFGFLAGAGLDFEIISSLYLRAETMFQLRLPTKLIKDTADELKAAFKLLGVSSIDVKSTLGLGAVLKLAVGYKF